MIAESDGRTAGLIDLVQQIQTFSVADKGKSLHEYFELNPDAEGVVIVSGSDPAGIIMRSEFYQKMGRQFGYNLYYNRPLDILMKKEPLVVDSGMELSDLGMLSMGRPPENLYDFIIVRHNGSYAGAISIRDFLVEMSKAREREIELLKKQQDILREANESERRFRMELERMNASLNERNASIRNLLDNANQGFFQFSADLQIAAEYSRICDELFGCEIGRRDILSVLSPYADDETQSVISRAVEGAFRPGRQAAGRAYLSLLPGELEVRGRSIRFEYKLVNTADGCNVLVIMTDITAQKLLDAKLAREKSDIRLVMRALSRGAEIKHAIAGFREFAGGLQQCLAPMQNDSPALQSLYRQVHTYKGDFAQLGMLHAAQALQAVEDGLSGKIKAGAPAEEMAACLAPIICGNMLKDDINIIIGALGHGFFEEKETVTLALERLDAVTTAAMEAVPADAKAEVARRLCRIRHLSLRQEIAKYDEYLSFVAQGLAKSVQPIQFAGVPAYIDAGRYGGFLKALVHVFRNSVDHGIESPEERRLAGKPGCGAVVCNIGKSNGEILLAISDDGRGLDCAKIRRTAVKRGLLRQEEAEALDEAGAYALILADGFSTKETVSDVSGRGVGLSAVRQAVKELGGAMEIRSKPGCGTTFLFTLPFEWSE